MKKIVWTACAVAASLVVGAGDIAYLTTSGNDGTAVVNDSNHPFGTLAGAIDALGATGTVSVASGTYAFTTATAPDKYTNSQYTAGASCIIIEKAITVLGATGDSKDVVFKRDTAAGSARVFMLNNDGAKLKYLTVQDGKFTDGIRNGGNVLIGSSGGTVEDCVLKDGNAGNANNTNIGGGNIALMAGRCSRCHITGGKLSFYRPIGLNVMAAGSSVVENCLITKGVCTSEHEAANDEGAVALKDSAKLVNCTVTKNRANRFSGVNIISSKAKAINCIIYGNTVTYETDTRGTTSDVSANGVTWNRNNLSCYVNCGSDLDTSKYPQINDTCFTVAAEDFTDAENEDWTPDVNSCVRDKGSDYSQSGATSTTDYAGETRVSGYAVDVGCYELKSEFHFNSATVDRTKLVLGSSDTATFSVSVGDAQGEVTYTWDFGDGSDPVVTNETQVSHTYLTVGSYTVTVEASCLAGEVSYTYPTKLTVIDFDVQFSRSAEMAITNRAVVFTATTAMTDPVTYTWVFGDGAVEVTTETQISHVYQTGGKYMVSVEADGGASGVIDYAFETELSVVNADLYVKSNGSGTYPFASWATAAKTLDVVKPYFIDGVTVHVAPGTYQTKDWQVVVTNAITLVGEGETPHDVVFFNGYANFNSGTRNMVVRNPNALVKNLTLKGGWSNFMAGGNLLLESGVVSNCVLTTGGSNSSGGSGGAAYVTGGLLTHCIITNAYLGNRGDGITIHQKGGRVSNCLITKNRKSWSGSRNAFSLVRVEGGVMDNCTIADCWILKNNPNNKLQMGTASDKVVRVDSTGKVYNLTIADVRWDIAAGTGESYEELFAEVSKTKPQRWAGTAANFVNCATDDATPINDTCFIGTLEKGSLFVDYDARNLTPGSVARNHGAEVTGFAFPSVDLAGHQRVRSSAVDIGCYEYVPAAGLQIFVR